MMTSVAAVDVGEPGVVPAAPGASANASNPPCPQDVPVVEAVAPQLGVMA